MWAIEESWYFAQEGSSGWQVVDVSYGYPFKWWAQWIVDWRKRERSDPTWYRYRIFRYY